MDEIDVDICRVEGDILLDGEDIYDKKVDPVQLRAKVGMVFQKPNPFPTMSVFDNVVSGLKLTGVRDRARLMEVAEQGQPITIDLENQVVTTPFQDRFEFPIDAFRKHCLLNGLDEISLTLEMGKAITSHEARLAKEQPWIAGAAHR